MQSSYMLSDSRWEEIKTIIEPKGRRHKVSLRVIVSGIINLPDNDCKWKGLPSCYGHYKLVWYYYNKWMLYGTLEQLLYLLSRKVRLDKQSQRLSFWTLTL